MATGGFGDAALKYWPIAAGLGATGWAWFKSWASGRRAREHERGELITIAQNAAKGVVGMLTQENERLNAELDNLRRDFDTLKESTTKALMLKDAEIMLKTGDLRQALAFAGAYDRLLTEAGIAHDKPSKPFWELVDGEVKLIDRGTS